MTALIDIRNLWREFPSGDEVVAVLKNINLTIEAGDMVAIMGASGSGKSTLMNIMGCLDRPSRGNYHVAGRNTAEMTADELAELRRKYFGFIFQRYHLLADLDALGNVETPAIYEGMERGDRHARAKSLLERLGLGERLHHQPGQLSGGQQQRVSIARALMNGGMIILADEPTGALDTKSGIEVMAVLKELNSDGHTVILVTHDAKVADHARRIIEIEDGEIKRDHSNADFIPHQKQLTEKAVHSAPAWQAIADRTQEALFMALKAMMAHRLRTFLTMLGIIIGIASVVSVIALGAGSQKKILESISAMGTNTIDIYPGKDYGDMRSARVQTLSPRDADALSQQDYVDSVTPGVSSSVTLRHGNMSLSATVNGVGEQFFRVKGYEIAAGTAFGRDSVARYAQDAVIDDNTRQKLFPGSDPIGKVIFLNNVPCRIVGVTAPRDAAFGNSEALNIWVPYTAAMSRLTGQKYLRSITVRVSDHVKPSTAEAGIVNFMTARHGTKDFFIMNTDTIRETVEKTTRTMTLLVSAIALISLVVGGIGVMNIMLVSVTERTREIGVRVAVGARQSDIMQQFLIEAVLVCLLGGALGIGLALGIGAVFDALVKDFSMIYSTASMVAAFTCATMIGIIFGFLPARNAARLDPVEALARE